MGRLVETLLTAEAGRAGIAVQALVFDGAGFEAIAAAALVGAGGFKPQASFVGAGLLEVALPNDFEAGATTLERSGLGIRESIRRRS